MLVREADMVANRVLVMTAWEESMKKGPVWLPLRMMYCIRADTGQSEFFIRPNTTSDPEPYWSHFDTFG